MKKVEEKTNIEENNFQKFIDGMFVALIMGYFSLEMYDKIAVAYKRYKKITANQIVVTENDLTIDVYYFASQYLQTKRNQYIEKLQLTNNNSSNFKHVKDLIIEITTYFKMPLNLA